MDKTKIKHDKNDSVAPIIVRPDGGEPSVHKLPSKGESSFHKAFGLWICRSGRGARSPSTVEERGLRYFEFYCISQLTEGTGYYRDADSNVTVFKPGKGVLVAPGCHHMYGGYHDFYRENTICFSGRLVDVLRSLGIITSGIITMDAPQRLLDISRKAMDPSLTSQSEANTELLAYLHDLHRMNLPESETGDLLDELTTHIQDDHSRWWTVREMADFCKMSEVRLRTVFRERHGMSPKRYLDSLKVNSAIDLMTDPGMTISDIATALGYVDPFHFSRRFKQLTGHSPRDYRQQILVK